MNGIPLCFIGINWYQYWYRYNVSTFKLDCNSLSNNIFSTAHHVSRPTIPSPGFV